jgi:hypothetical protein
MLHTREAPKCDLRRAEEATRSSVTSMTAISGDNNALPIGDADTFV